MENQFAPIGFRGELRPSQAEVVGLARRQLEAGQRRLHVVAPPGSGKTVTGLYVWAQLVRRPALVLSPNSAIQSQWARRTDLFELPAAQADLVSTDPQTPRLLTSLTYQSVTLPRRGGEDIDGEAVALWQDRLVEAGQAQDPEEARIWIEDLARHNPDYHQTRLSAYRKQVRDGMALGGDAQNMGVTI